MDFIPRRSVPPSGASAVIGVPASDGGQCAFRFLRKTELQFQGISGKRMKEGTLTGLTQEDIAYLAKMAQVWP